MMVGQAGSTVEHDAVATVLIIGASRGIGSGAKADGAELAEIDENLIHIDLTPAERAMHITRRKELYEKLHPETQKGATGKGRPKKS
jgi:hypothetical protein